MLRYCWNVVRGKAGMLYMAMRQYLQGYCGTECIVALRECCILQGYWGTVSPNVLWHCGNALSCKDTVALCRRMYCGTAGNAVSCRDTVALCRRMYCGTAGMLYPAGILAVALCGCCGAAETPSSVLGCYIALRKDLALGRYHASQTEQLSHRHQPIRPRASSFG